MSNNEQALLAEQLELSVGQLFRQEREQRKLTLEQVAKQLNLKVEVIKSLEADQPDKAILPTFMRGYVRAYARFLKIPEQALLTRFEQVHQVQSTPIKAMKTFSNRQAKQLTETRFMWLTYIIVALLLASLAAWLWQGAREFTSEAFNTSGEAMNSASEAANTVSEDPLLNIPIDDSSLALSQTDPEPIIEPMSEPVAAINIVDNAASADDAPVAEVIAVAEASVVLEGSSESFGDSNNSALDRLKMTFSDNCWIDVLDANGDRIAYGTKQGGYVMELNARGPFTITLGNPGVVAIDINEKPFDMSGFPGGRVAKFTLAGQDE